MLSKVTMLSYNSAAVNVDTQMVTDMNLLYQTINYNLKDSRTPHKQTDRHTQQQY